MLCIEGRLTYQGGITGSLSSSDGVVGSLESNVVEATLSADVIEGTLTSHSLGIIATLTSNPPIEARISSSDIVDGSLTRQGSVNGTLAHGDFIRGSLQGHGGGIQATLQEDAVSFTLVPDTIEATLTTVPVNAYFSYSCPIDYINSCFSLGGWYNDLGWDNDLGWNNN